MGTGDETFGRTLLKNFIYTLKEQDVLPDMMLFYNGGVPLVTDTSESLADLRELAAVCRFMPAEPASITTV